MSLTFFRLLSKTIKNLSVGFIVNSLNNIGELLNVKLSRISFI